MVLLIWTFPGTFQWKEQELGLGAPGSGGPVDKKTDQVKVTQSTFCDLMDYIWRMWNSPG